MVPVPYLFGRTRGDAEKLSDAAGFTTRFVGPGGPDATVIAQSVEAGQSRPRGSQINLRMGLVGGGSITAPRLLGLNRGAASGRAEASGLKPLFYGPNEPGVLVASQSVPAGQQVARGTYIQLQMRAPVASLRTPNFSGLSIEAARALAASSRLRPIFSGDEGQGSHVVSQAPGPGSETSSGAEVALRLGISQTRVPRFTGRSRAAAMAIAAKTGLTLNISGDESASARVSQQTPSPGASVAPSSAVEVVMAAAAVVQTPGLIVPQLIGLTRAEAAGALGQSSLRMESTGSASENAVVMSQSPAAAMNAAPGDIVRVVLSVVSRQPAAVTPAAHGVIPTNPSHSRSWLAPLGGLTAAAAALVAWLVFRRPKPDDIVVPPPPKPEPGPGPKPKPVAPVVYSATIDAGRPTVRFAHEPPFAARALTLPRATEGTKS